MYRLFIVTMLLSVAPLYAADYSKPPIFLRLQDVLPDEQTKGSNFKIDARVRDDGLIDNYEGGRLLKRSTRL